MRNLPERLKEAWSRARRLWPLLLIALIAIAIGVHDAGGGSRSITADQKSFSALQSKVADGKVKSLEVVPSRQALKVTLREPGASTYEVGYPTNQGKEGLSGLLAKAHRQNVQVTSEPLPNTGPSIITTLLGYLPILFMVGLIAAVAMSQGLFGRRAPNNTGAGQEVGFSDVAGVGEAVQELSEVRTFLSDPEFFEAAGARVPKGVLLHGPPGTGKTLLAKAVANEAGVPFFGCSGSEFVEMFAGLGARRVRSLFKEAKKQAPSIIFIDELDAVGQKRGAGAGDGGSREADQTLIELLRQMDGFETGQEPSGSEKLLQRIGRRKVAEEQHPVIVIGATNRLESLDPALTRPGRFDRHVAIDPPDRRGRKEILEVHSRSKQIAADVDLGLWAAKTAGMSGADLALLLNEAALNAARHRRSVVDDADLDHALLRLVAGAEKQHRTLSDKERERVAYHEAGHGIVREVLKDSHVVHKISIIPRGRSGGQTIHVSEEDVFLHPESKLRDTLATLMGGRAAEDLALGEVSSGAADDLEKASEVAERMLAHLGMSKALGLRVDLPSITLSDGERAALDAEIKSLLAEQYERARQILDERSETMKLIARTLLEEETLDRARFLELLAE